MALGYLCEKYAVPNIRRITRRIRAFSKTRGLASKAHSGRSSGLRAPWPSLMCSQGLLYEIGFAG